MKLMSAHSPRIAISIPSPDYVHIQFLQSLMRLQMESSGKVDHMIHHAIGSRITLNRNRLVDMARDAKATHLLFLDADMVFPPDVIPHLLAYKKDIVCATYSKRDSDRRPIGKLVSGETAVAKGPLVEFALVGFGCMLIKMETFDKLPKPYFAEPQAEGCDFAEGEDMYFCRRVRAAGYQIWVDVPLSERMGHIGSMVYYMDNTPRNTPG
jgi:hypothetical protein